MQIEERFIWEQNERISLLDDYYLKHITYDMLLVIVIE